MFVNWTFAGNFLQGNHCKDSYKAILKDLQFHPVSDKIYILIF
jgi:hypothetical protein